MATARIAICGKLRSGKSTIASHLALNHGFERVSFGSSLKHFAEEIFRVSDVYPVEYYTINDTPCPLGIEPTKYKRKPRKLFQDFGEALRALDPEIWVKHAEESIKYYENQRDCVGIVIDDLRNPLEYDWARANGFTIVRISANEDTRIARAKAAGDDFSEDDLRHPTEQYIDDFEADYEIWNDDDNRAELERKIDEIIRSLPSEK